MTTVWVLVLIALTIAVGLLALYSLGEGRRVLRAVSQRSSDVVFLPSADRGHGPPIGDQAPTLPPTATNRPAGTATGAPRLVLFAEAGCGPCTVLAADLSRRPVDANGTDLVVVIDEEAFAKKFGDEWTVIVDPDWQVAGTWQVTGTPHVTLIDQHGHVSQNTVVNTRKEVQRLVRNGAAH